jgi:hypothetical protein
MSKPLFRRRVLLPVLGLTAAVAITTAAGAAQGPKEPKVKADRDTPAVMKDIKEGKAKKVKAEKRTTGVWDGCRFHYLKTDESTWEFDDGSVANVSENPEPLPPKDQSCGQTRNPTSAEMAEMERRVSELNPRHTAGGPPAPPWPPDRYRGTL